MSVRIYQLSKEIGMENAELIALLKGRGHEVKSASSTIDNMSAESLREEYAPKVDEPVESGESPEPPPAIVEPDIPKVIFPSGAIVRSKEDIERERGEREEEERIKAEELHPPKPVVMSGKTPPPLPMSPVVRRRTALVTPVQHEHQGPPSVAPRVPILRTDLPKAEVLWQTHQGWPSPTGRNPTL